MNEITGSLLTEVYRSPANFEANFSKHLFDGYFSAIQNASIPGLIWLSIPFLFLFIIFGYQKKKSKPVLFASITIAVIVSAFLSIRVSFGYDEFFLNLRHSLLFSNGSGFSVNMLHKVEATVDFLPFFLIGCLGKFGLPLPELGIACSFLGNILCILAAYSISKRISRNDVFALITALLIAIFPGIIANGATGFMANLFSAVILWAVHDLFFDRSVYEKRGIFLTAILCLFRIEGILFTLLVWAWIYCLEPLLRTKDCKHLLAKKFYIVTALMFAPFLALELGRYLYFGYATPVPVVYKSSITSLFFWKMGFRYGAKVFLEFKGQLMLALAALSYLLGRKRCSELSALFWLSLPTFLVLAIFELPYHMGGGDWFPVRWARYEMPFLLFMYLICWNMIFIFIRSIQPQRAIWLFVAGIFLLSPIFYDFIMLPPLTAVAREKKGVYSSLLRDLQVGQNRWERIDRLAAFGEFIQITFPSHSLMASSELATIFYFSKMEILDLLGLVNRELASSPLNPFTDVDPTTRRRMPSLIDKYHPPVLAYPTMAVFPASDVHNSADEVRVLNDQIFIDNLMGLHLFVAGTFEHKEKLGYHHVAIFFRNIAFDYWVSGEAFVAHRQKLLELGLSAEENISVTYHLQKSVRDRWLD